jgi:hypothetical protein
LRTLLPRQALASFLLTDADDPAFACKFSPDGKAPTPAPPKAGGTRLPHAPRMTREAARRARCLAALVWRAHLARALGRAGRAPGARDRP